MLLAGAPTMGRPPLRSKQAPRLEQVDRSPLSGVLESPRIATQVVPSKSTATKASSEYSVGTAALHRRGFGGQVW